MPKFAPKLTYGTTIADWQERINVARMREERAARARQMMRQHGIPVLLAATNSDVRYLTGIRGAFFAPQLRYVLFFADQDPVLFEHAGSYQQMPDQAPWIKNWRPARSWLGGIAGNAATQEEAELFASEIQTELRNRGLAGEKLGIVGLDNVGLAALEKLKLNCVNARPVITEARTIKTRDEIECFKTVAAIVEAAWYRIWAALRPGIRGKEMDKVLAAALVDAGADSVLSASWKTGPATFERGFGAEDRLIQTGDLVYAPLCHVKYLGYNSCNYRTFIVGRKPNDKEKDWCKAVVERLDAVIDAIKPGATTADAAKFFPPASKWGYSSEVEVLSVEIGHGLSMGEGYDPPVINRQWSLKHPQVFEPGMIIAVETLEGEHRVGGVRLENMLVVTETGAEIIDHFIRDEVLVAPM